MSVQNSVTKRRPDFTRREEIVPLIRNRPVVSYTTEFLVLWILLELKPYDHEGDFFLSWPICLVFILIACIYLPIPGSTEVWSAPGSSLWQLLTDCPWLLKRENSATVKNVDKKKYFIEITLRFRDRKVSFKKNGMRGREKEKNRNKTKRVQTREGGKERGNERQERQREVKQGLIVPFFF